MRQLYKITINTQGKDYETQVKAVKVHTAASRALSKWRGSKKYNMKGGPGYGKKPKEITLKITRQ